MSDHIIDFHTHIFPQKIAKSAIASLEERAHIKAQSDGTIEGLLHSMEEAGVDQSIILPVVTKPQQFEKVNLFAAKLNEKYEGRLISFGGIHPLDTDYKEKLKFIQSLGIKGIKLHPDYQETMIDDAGYIRIIDYASQLGLIISVHAGIDIGLPNPVHCTPQRAAKVIDEVKPPKLVLAHTGGWKMWEDVKRYLVGKEVFLDCSFSSVYLKNAEFESIVREHGSDKILFATDSPWENPKDTLGYIQSTDLSNMQKMDILSKNACRLLGL